MQEPVTPTQTMPPAPPMQIMPSAPAMPPQAAADHTRLWILIGVLVVISILAGAYFMLLRAGSLYNPMEKRAGTDTSVEQPPSTNNTEATALQAELQAESLGDLGAELGNIDQELAQ